MTPERKGEIRKMLGDALRKDFAAANVKTQEEAQYALRNPEFRTPNLKAATQSLGKEYDVYEAQRGERPLKSALTHSNLESRPPGSRSAGEEESYQRIKDKALRTAGHVNLDRADAAARYVYGNRYADGISDKQRLLQTALARRQFGPLSRGEREDLREAYSEQLGARSRKEQERYERSDKQLRAAASSTSKWERDEKTLRSMERDGATGWSR